MKRILSHKYVLILVSLAFCFPFRNLKAAEIPIQSSRPLRVQFDNYVELLKKEVSFNTDKDKKKRFALLDLALKQMKEIRSEVQDSSSAEAQYMDRVLASLEKLPSKKEFKRKKCRSYQQDLNFPESDELASNILKTLCQ